MLEMWTYRTTVVLEPAVDLTDKVLKQLRGAAGAAQSFP